MSEGNGINTSRLDTATIEAFRQGIANLVKRVDDVDRLLQGTLTEGENTGIKGRMLKAEYAVREFHQIKRELEDLVKHKDDILVAAAMHARHESSDLELAISMLCDHDGDILAAAEFARWWKRWKKILGTGIVGLILKLLYDLIRWLIGLAAIASAGGSPS